MSFMRDKCYFYYEKIFNFWAFLNQRSDRFYNFTLVRPSVRSSQIDLGNRSKDFSETWHEIGGQ